MELHLLGQIKLPKFRSVSFDRFAPLFGTQQRTKLANTEFAVIVSVDPEKHKGWITDLDQLNNLDKVSGLAFTGVYIELFVAVADDLARAVKNTEPHPELRALCERIVTALESVHDSFVELARHEVGEYWVPRRHSPSGPLHQRLLGYETRVRCDDGWRIVAVDTHEPVEVDSVAHVGITRDRWQAFLDRLEHGGGFRTQHPHRRLLANARAHQWSNDLRAAVIEGVAAWEMVLTRLGPRIFARSAASYTVEEWTAHIKKAGMTASSALLFAMTTNTGIVANSASVMAAIDMRNNVVHNGQHQLDPAAVDDALWAIQKTISACEEELAKQNDAA